MSSLLDERILIPKHISKYGCYSSVCMAVAGAIAIAYRFYVAGALVLAQAMLSYLNWYEVKRFSVIKVMDAMLAVLILTRITFVDSTRFPAKQQRIWITALVIILCTFVINEALLYYQVKARVFDSDPDAHRAPIYFSLTYTRTGTHEREYAYYRSTITHIAFIHLMPIIVLVYCIYMSS